MKWLGEQIKRALRWLDMTKTEVIAWIAGLMMALSVSMCAPPNSAATLETPENHSPYQGFFFTQCRAPNVDTEYRVIIHWQVADGTVMEVCSIIKAEDLDAALGKALKERM